MPAKKAARKAPAAKAVKAVTRPAAKGITTHKAFTQVVILSPGAELMAAEAELRLRTVARHLKATALPPILRVAQVHPNPQATALALYRAFRATGRGGPALYLCAGNPAEGALTILTTDWGNTFLAPNDGTLGLLATLFEARKIPHTLASLDTEAILSAEQARMQNPDWQPAEDFALRDLLAPTAAALLAGVPARRLTAGDEVHATSIGGLVTHRTAFAANLATLPLKLGQSVPLEVLKLEDGHLLLNLTLDPLSFDQLQDDRARFTLSRPSRCRWWPFTRKTVLTVAGADALHTEGTCCHSGACTHGHHHHHGSQSHLHLSAYAAPSWDERFLVLHLDVNGCCLKHILKGPLTLTRIR